MDKQLTPEEIAKEIQLFYSKPIKDGFDPEYPVKLIREQTASLQAGLNEAIEIFEWFGMIGGKGLREHERMREFITKYKPIIEPPKNTDNG